jgi:CDP-diglyceride synthetase
MGVAILISSCAMKRSNSKPRPWTLKERAFLGFVGAMVMALGVVTLLQGKLHYQNWWHAPVFAPFAVIVGALGLFVAFKGGRF